jgi:hypothetical protein
MDDTPTMVWMISQHPYSSTDQCAKNTGTNNTWVSTVRSIFTQAAALADRKRFSELIGFFDAG